MVLKGHLTLVASGTAVFVNPTGNPGMATGGIGDVLTGLIAGLLAQGLDALDATLLGRLPARPGRATSPPDGWARWHWRRAT